MITVLLVDDHPVVREGMLGMLSREPDLTVIGEAAGGAEAVTVASALRPDVVLMDLRMPDIDGATATEQILSACPGTRVVILTTYETHADIVRAVEAGASGYLLKGSSRAELTAAVRAAARGETVLAPSIVARLHPHEPRVALSARELEVLAHVATGSTNAEIGRLLHITETTVKTHLQRAFAKLDVSDRTAAVTAALARGLLPAP
ncbi:response regulator [Nocardia sp. ET3-3]|uniref:Response regulator n=1 Tax=Nocardia terrae TaxID=2675851 RepID=A0A7K1USS7_9NOCA|nr:response regulator transcription factor [Nocardia terrae]MVU77394.1 response regulator [Nocardia terrae]